MLQGPRLKAGQSMSWQALAYLPISLAGAVVLAIAGYRAWQRRGVSGKPGSGTLAIVLWVLALWGLVYAVELVTASRSLVDALHALRDGLFVVLAPLWLVLVLRYTGRERWLRLRSLALIFALPVVTIALVLLHGADGVMRFLAGEGGADPVLHTGTAYGEWFWVGFVYSALLVLLGAALLVLVLVSFPNLYRAQSVCLLLGFVGPWVAYAIHISGLDYGADIIAGLDPAALTLIPAGLALLLALNRYKLLDVSPVAHDAVVDGMSDGTLVLDMRSRIVGLNPSAANMLRCEPDGVVGRNFQEVMNKLGKAAPLSGNRGSALNRRYEESGQAHEEIKLGEGDDERHYDLTLSSLFDGRGRRTGHLVVLHEITERKLAVEKLGKMAHYDALTGLPNRTLFYERLQLEITRTRRRAREKGLLALMFLDLDRFKIINDTLGHDAGDEILKETARRLKAAVREYDVVARLAGDEFTVILPEISGPEDATDIASRIIAHIGEPYTVDGNELRVTTSVGVCFHPNDGHDPATLVKNADAAMYRAKASGKNRYEVFAGDVLQVPANEREVENGEVENELKRAIGEEQFVLHFRPVVQTSTNRLSGVEALVRWAHPRRGLLYPKDFLPVAKETGLILPIERWVLNHACRQTRHWQERYPTGEPLTLSVGIPSEILAHPSLCETVEQALEASGLAPENLILEIEADVLHENVVSAGATLGSLKDLGVGLAVDGLGASYASLHHLKRLPLDILKIDAAFIHAQEESEEDRKILAAVLGLARALGLKTVAEGVRSPRELVRLREMGCEVAQANYLGESLAERAFSALLVDQ